MAIRIATTTKPQLPCETAMNNFRLLLVEDNPVEQEIVTSQLAKSAGSSFVVHVAYTLLDALNELTMQRFDVVLTELNLPDSRGLDTLTTLLRRAGGLPIVVRSGMDGQAVATEAVERGAQDYVSKSVISPEALARVLRYAIMRSRTSSEAAKAELTRATLVGFLGAKGGVGTTTLGCQFAMELRKQADGTVLLMELDTGSSPTAFLMQRDSQYSVQDACTNLYRLDDDFWRGLVSTGGDDSVDLLQSPAVPAAADPLTGERVRHVLRFARSLYSWVVVDLGRLTSLSLDVLPDVQELYVVTTPDLPSLYLTSRQLKRLLDLGMRTEQIHLIVNRVAGGGVVVSDLERVLGFPVYAEVADYAEELTEAYSDRRFTDEKLRLRKAVRKITSKLLGIEPKVEARGLFRFPRLKPAAPPASAGK